MLTWLDSGEDSTPDLQVAAFSLCALRAFSRCMPYGDCSLSYKTTRPIRLGPIWPHLTLITSFKKPQSPNMVILEFRASTCDWIWEGACNQSIHGDLIFVTVKLFSLQIFNTLSLERSINVSKMKLICECNSLISEVSKWVF